MSCDLHRKFYFYFCRVNTWHIHIEGIVQGVGFRPFVYRYAVKEGLKGWVNNTNDGVHIHINATEEQARRFLETLLRHLPPLAVVNHYEISPAEDEVFEDFSIVKSESAGNAKVLLTPDVAMCADCREELSDADNRRYRYPFITCTNCGPRYSIITSLPYDRPATTMAKFLMCPECKKEYHNPMERRHFSQTNSCPACSIEMQLYENGRLQREFDDLEYITRAWKQGKIVAVKGIGGYLLCCDAGNREAVKRLRLRKHRAKKPFALMFPSVDATGEYVFLSAADRKALLDIDAPIVLLRKKTGLPEDICPALNEIDSGLNRLGIMLPYTPLLELLLRQFGKPVVATSANISDSSIVFTDEDAIAKLRGIADMLLMNNRDIVVPQDDGVMQFTQLHQQRIVLRRSRGKAPVYLASGMKLSGEAVLACGAMLKSAFGFVFNENIIISQYLGNTANYEAQENYLQTYEHLSGIFDAHFHKVVTDIHPAYFSTDFGEKTAREQGAELIRLQHHKAHFYAVLGENELLDTEEEILGVVWDGTGLGEDGTIRGGEFFSYSRGNMELRGHLDDFPFILGDKMVKEARISALVLSFENALAQPLIRSKFTAGEWRIYRQLIPNTKLRCTSMGRLFDAVASLLLGIDVQAYEAEASMQLEKTASLYFYQNKLSLGDAYVDGKLPGNFTVFVVNKLLQDIADGLEPGLIAARFHITLVKYVDLTAQKYGLKKIAFSGGVFQNALLVDMMIEFLGGSYQLYFHRDLSPNDECIPFGQLMYALQANRGGEIIAGE